jgi:puromycin-sensitive aminopeptidase
MSSSRLPRHVVPDRYDIEISVEIAACRFEGTETVEISVREAATEIVLNAAELVIRDVVAQGGAGRRLEGQVELDETAERVVLRFPELLQPGNWRLSLGFTGALNDKLRGFYRSTFTGADGAPAALAVTQFEATDARRAFPCWDEPAFKAVFRVTLVVDEGLTALSNMAAAGVRRIPATRQQAVTFAPTVKMSTYLLAFVVGRLESSEPVTVRGIPIRVWAVPGKRHLAAFALEAAAFCLRFFEEYYGVPYPGDKLDLIAIPDFAFGAMENLGAITFRETALLVDAQAATHAEQARVAHVVVHEIAHMWFGDLVTMAWWNGLWLNEAFATFMEVLAVDAWKPAWGRWDHFGVSRAAAFATDGLQSSRPIEYEVVAPKDAEAMFDVLTYEKGGAVVRMLEQYLEPAVFREGVRSFLVAYQFANAETTDLWRALGEASGQPIPAIMDGWIFRQGYPLVTVELDGAGETVRFRQRAFRYERNKGGAGDIWQVPIRYRARVNGEVVRGRLLLASPEERVTFRARPDWIVANEEGHGFYRVRYASELLAPLLRAPAAHLSPIERFTLLNDAWASTLAGILPVADYLEMTGRFKGETDRHVWTALVASFGYLSRIVPSDLRPGLERIVCDRLGEIAARVGWAGAAEESDLARELRGEILRTRGILGNDPTLQLGARQRYAGSGSETLDPNVLAAVIAIVAHTTGEAEYEEFLARFKAAKTPQEEQRYLRALAGFRQPELIDRTLRLSVSGEVRTQDAPFLVRDLLMGVYSRECAWAFVKEHWDKMERLYPSQSGLRRLCEGITGLATPALEADVRSFFARRKVPFGGKSLEQYLEQLRIAVLFQAREAQRLATFLAGY